MTEPKRDFFLNMRAYVLVTERAVEVGTEHYPPCPNSAEDLFYKDKTSERETVRTQAAVATYASLTAVEHAMDAATRVLDPDDYRFDTLTHCQTADCCKWYCIVFIDDKAKRDLAAHEAEKYLIVRGYIISKEPFGVLR